MRIFIAGVACVGKTTVGERLAALLGYRFFNVDSEIERYFNTPLARLQNRCLTAYSFSLKAAEVLKHILSRPDSADCVIALPPSGLLRGYWKVVKTVRDSRIVVLDDTPENILKRITFYDDDSQSIEKTLSDREKRLYLKDIREDITYFRRSYERAHLWVDIAGCGPDDAALKVKDAVAENPSSWRSHASERPDQQLP